MNSTLKEMINNLKVLDFPIIIFNSELLPEYLNKSALKIFKIKSGAINSLKTNELKEKFPFYDSFQKSKKDLIKSGKLHLNFEILSGKKNIKHYSINLTVVKGNKKSGEGIIGFINELDYATDKEVLSRQKTLKLESSSHAIEKRKTENKLRESEKRFRTLFENNPLLNFAVDANGRIISLNENGAKELGYTKEELIGKIITSVFFEEDQPIIKYQLRECLENPGKVFSWELRKVHKNGKIIWVRETACAVPGKIKSPEILIVCDNITPQKETEKTLIEYANSLQVILDASPLGALVYNLDDKNQLKLITANQSAEKILNLRSSELIFKNIEEIFAPLKHLGLVDKFKEIAIHGGELKDQKIKYLDKNISGTFEYNVIKLAERTIAVFFTDITERERSRERLTESELKYKTLFESSNDSILLLKDGLFVDCNDKSLEIFNCKKEDLIGKPPQAFSPDIQPNGKESKALAMQKITSAINGNPQRFEWFHQRLDGSQFFAEVSLFKVELKGENYLQAIVRDVSERKISQETISEQRRTIHTLMNNLPGMAYRCQNNLDWTMEFVSEGCLGLTGYSQDELMYNTLTSYGKIIHDEDAKMVFESVNEALKIKNPFTILYRIITKEGKLKWVWEKGQGVFDENGNLVCIEGFITDITERKIAEEKVKILAHTMKNISECVVITDMNDTIKYVNDSFCETYKYKPEEIIGNNIIAIRSTKNPSKVLKSIVPATLAGGWKGEIINVRKNGEEFPISLSTTLIKDDLGNPIGFAGVSTDITESKKSKQILVESEERFRSLVNNMIEAALIIDWNGKILFANNSAAKLVEMEDPELGVGKSITEFLHPSDITKVIRILAFEKEGAGEITDQFHVLTINGKDRWVDALTTKITFEDQISLLITLRDITEKRKVEEQIDLLTNALNSAANGVVITASDGKILWVNRAFESLTGFSAKDVINEYPSKLKSYKMEKEFYKNMWEVIMSGEVWRGELINKKKDGTLYDEEMTITPMKNNNDVVTHFIAVKQDITERKRAEKELKEAKEKAEELSKIKSNFLANMSHELRTPLVGILGFAELLRDEKNRDEQVEMAERILFSGKRLMVTLNSVLDLARIEANKIELNITQINISNAVKESVKTFEILAANKKLYLNTKILKEVIVSELDAQILNQILNNLINNAIKYTQTGGVTIEVDIKKFGHNEFAEILISDTGIGIPESSIKLIFEEFRQVSEGINRHFEGTGLGLSITKRFVELMNGTIEVESKEKVGSKFKVRFPLANKNGLTKLEDISKSLKEKTQEELKLVSLPDVLFVENDEASQEITKLFLKNLCRLTIVPTGEEGIKLAKERKFKAVMMDINLGKGMSGTDAALEISKLPGYKQVPIIAVTAFAMQGDKEEFFTAGCTHYISKPFRKNEITDLMMKILFS